MKDDHLGNNTLHQLDLSPTFIGFLFKIKDYINLEFC